MSATASTMLPLTTKAPDFHLPDTEGKTVSLSDLRDARALVVVFLCNHCPFVKHVIRDLVDLAKEYQDRGVAFVAINSNDVATYPDDRPEMMAKFAKQRGFTFPYLYDETQEVAKAYRAACTPDFFVFDEKRELIYRGQMDDSRPGNGVPITGADLCVALDGILEGGPVPANQKPSMGCNIKWKAGNEPDYF
ncbi:MAG: thioredoxin family protein [Sedimentisphaerales bacterium]|nr:thioredoxin family protein [Sedimentisphaerales bacterium]HNY80349.1 thioredoxin family protein [Sedimentisphaerales bacterium]HOC64352.1 thioredoxin family protein [Sedimentisphaerales bacterium]HOH65996.1 thioredoxin family protein [Sedimentisphaerales bacterium]HPY50085.1 thioredoxin family protein [Sedimentisphaerales bacterium]